MRDWRAGFSPRGASAPLPGRGTKVPRGLKPALREAVTLTVNGAAVAVPAGAMVSTAVALAGAVRRSVTGEPRGPLCGMGICFECRVTINGRPHCRGCQVVCEPGMEVRTDA